MRVVRHVTRGRFNLPKQQTGALAHELPRAPVW